MNKSTFTGTTVNFVIPPLDKTTQQTFNYADTVVYVWLTIPSENSGAAFKVGEVKYRLSYSLVVSAPQPSIWEDASTYYHKLEFKIIHYGIAFSSIVIYIGEFKYSSVHSSPTYTTYNTNSQIDAFQVSVSSVVAGTILAGEYFDVAIVLEASSKRVGLAAITYPNPVLLESATGNTTKKPLFTYHPLILSSDKNIGLKYGKQTITLSTSGMIVDSTAVYIGSNSLVDTNYNKCDISAMTDSSITCVTTEISTQITSDNCFNTAGVEVDNIDNTNYLKTTFFLGKNYKDNMNVSGDDITYSGQFCPPISGYYRFYIKNTIAATFKVLRSGSLFAVLNNISPGSAFSFSNYSDFYYYEEGSCFDILLSFTATASFDLGISTIICKDGLFTGTNTEIKQSCIDNVAVASTASDDFENIIIVNITINESSTGGNMMLTINGASTNLGTYTYNTTKRENILSALITAIPSIYNKIDVNKVSSSGTGSGTEVYQIYLYNLGSAITFAQEAGAISSVTYLKNYNKFKFIADITESYLILKPQYDSSNNNRRIYDYMIEVTTASGKTLPAITINPPKRLFKVIPDGTFPTIQSFTFDYDALTMTVTLDKALSEANTYLTAESHSSATLVKMQLGNNEFSCTATTSTLYSCTIASFNYGQEAKMYIPEFITEYGRLNINTNLCTSTMGILNRSPYYSCDCTKYLDVYSYTCVDKCGKEYGTTNDYGICDYCGSPFKAYDSKCVTECPEGFIEFSVTVNSKEKYYCDECTSGYYELGSCVTKCSDGFGVRADTKYCENCQELGKYSFDQLCVSPEDCPLDTFLSKTADKNSDSTNQWYEWYCDYCDTGLLAQNSTCVNGCTNGYAFSKANDTILNDYCYLCQRNGTYEYNGTCVDSCELYHVKSDEPAYCYDCDYKKVVSKDKNKCETECGEYEAINVVKLVEGDGFIYRTYCTACDEGMYVQTKDCTFNCNGLDQIRSCVDKCSSNSIVDEENKACTLCPDSKPYINDNTCVDSCYEYQIVNTLTNHCEYCSDYDKLMYNNACVDSCPDNYIAYENVACLSCNETGRLYILNNECLTQCPYGYLPVYDGKYYYQCELIDLKLGCSGANEEYCLNGASCDINLDYGLRCYCEGDYRGARCQYTTNEISSVNQNVETILLQIKNSMATTLKGSLEQNTRKAKLMMKDTPGSISESTVSVIKSILNSIDDFEFYEMFIYEISDFALFTQTIE